MKELERFLIIGWVVGEEYAEKIQIIKQASSIPYTWFTRVKLRRLVQRVGFLKKGESLRFLSWLKSKEIT